MRSRTDPSGRAARDLRRAWPGVTAGEVDAVHRARVATRRLREALSANGAERRARRLRRDLRAVTRALGPIRELDVSIGLVVRLAQEAPGLEPQLELVRQALMARRARRRARLASRLDGLDVPALAAGAARMIDSAPAAGHPFADDQDPASRQVRARVARRAGQLRDALSAAGALYAPEPLHASRIAVKKLRYALELARSAGVRGVSRDAARLRRIQDLLGELRDWQVLADHVGRVHTSLPLGDERLGGLGVLLSDVEDRCRAIHAQFVTRRSELLALSARLTSAFEPAGAACRRS